MKNLEQTEFRRAPFGATLAFSLGWAVFAGSLFAAEPLPTAVTIPPQAELVKRIGGDRVSVEVVVPPGQDPHTFTPTPRRVMSLARAGVYFGVGVPLEGQVLGKLRGASRGLLVVDTTEGIELRKMEGHGACQHSHHHHHHGHEHQHCDHAGARDPHVWLAPKLLVVQAQNICRALCKADPAGAATYRANLEKLTHELEEVDAEIAAALKPYRGQSFFVFHPALGYFADAYGLRQVAVEIEGKSPTPRQLRDLIGRARAQGVKILFVQPQFDQRSAKAIASAIGGAVVPIDPLRRDVLANLREIGTQMQQALKR